MLKKRGEIWYAVIRYQNLNGINKKKWISTGTANKREAERYERTLLHERDTGKLVLAHKDAKTLGEFLDEWLDTCVKPPTRSLGTYQNYKYCCTRIKDHIGKRKLDSLTSLDITKFYRKCLQEGLSTTTVRMYHRVLRRAMGRAKSWKFIGFNPVPDAELPPPKKSPAIALDIEPAMNLLHHSETISLSVNAAIALGMLCGLRRSEIVGLRWNDWDKEKQRLYIRHGLTRRSSDGLVPENYEYCAPAGKSFLVLDRVKTEASENYIEAKGYINDILAQLELRYNVNKMKFGPAFKDLNFIMCEECGFPRDPRYIFYAVSKTIATYNETHEDQLPYLRAHDLRHTAATLLLESNVDVKYVSRQLRHSSTTITRDLYQHVTDKMLSETADVMDNLVRPKKVATHVATHKA